MKKSPLQHFLCQDEDHSATALTPLPIPGSPGPLPLSQMGSSTQGCTSRRQDILFITHHPHCLQRGCGQTHSWFLPRAFLLLKKIIIYSLWYHTKEKKQRQGNFNEGGLFWGQDFTHKLKGRDTINIIPHYLSKCVWLLFFSSYHLYLLIRWQGHFVGGKERWG